MTSDRKAASASAWLFLGFLLWNIVQISTIIVVVTGTEFIRRVRKLGKARGIPVRFETRLGKGSHGRLFYGGRFTTVKDRKKDIGPGLVHAMLAQLGLSEGDIAV
ncbi:MAG: type II toxin-antitoxin system HicA family toxin [Gammaproteobacteria bacterium]